MIINLRSVLATIQGSTPASSPTGFILRRGEAAVSCDMKGLDRAAFAALFRSIADVLEENAQGVPQADPPAPPIEFSLEDCKPEDIFLGTPPAPEPTYFKSKRGKR